MSFRVRTKIWIENDAGELIISTGRVQILEAVREAGSLNKAAHELKQPFRAVWGKIKATENRCGFKVIEASSTGSTLTREGVELLEAYSTMQKRCESFAEGLFREIFSERSLVQNGRDEEDS